MSVTSGNILYIQKKKPRQKFIRLKNLSIQHVSSTLTGTWWGVSEPFYQHISFRGCFRPLSWVSSNCCGNCHWTGKSHHKPPGSETSDKQNMINNLFIITTVTEIKEKPVFLTLQPNYHHICFTQLFTNECYAVNVRDVCVCVYVCD